MLIKFHHLWELTDDSNLILRAITPVREYEHPLLVRKLLSELRKRELLPRQYGCLLENLAHRAACFRYPQDVVGLFVGFDHGEITLDIHENAASFHSPVFEPAFKSEVIEVKEQKYRLENSRQN